MNKKRSLLFLLFFISGFYAAYASHIVGGEIYYQYQGNHQYHVKLILYRDCSNPNNLLLDDSTEITAYSRSTLDQVNFTVYRQNLDTLPITLNTNCSQLPDVCVEKHVYTATITLPSSAGGWTIFFSTCCRNATVGNIESPDNTGATYLVNIPPDNQLAQGFGNSEFKSFPPIAICVGSQISFDNSIIKHSGDSIVYSLYTPFDEVDSNSNHQFVFNPIVWKLPYSESDMLGGVPLTINPATGFLSGTPNTVGQFLVGVDAKVYRNGLLASETRRDFQFNVTNCFNYVGFTFNKTCGSKTVTFTNRTVGHTTYTWDFGDGSPVSHQVNPSYTYASFGTYTVTLHVDSVAGCPSVFSQIISLGIDKPTANFNIPAIPTCIGKNDTIRLTDLSRDTINFPIVSWQWYVDGVLFSFDKNAVYYFDPNDAIFFNTIYIKLVVKNITGCADSITKTITIKGVTPTYDLLHDYALCQPGKQQSFHVSLDYDFFDFLSFKWTPSNGVSNTIIADPVITVSQPATYYVTIFKTTNGFTCSTIDSIEIKFTKPDIYVPKDTTSVCGINNIKITPAGDSVIYSIQWSDKPDFSNIVATTNSIIIIKPVNSSVVTYYYNTDFGSGCSYKDSVKITFISSAPSIQLVNSASFCSRDISVLATITPSTSVQWSTDRNLSSVISTDNPLVLTQAQNQVKYFIRAGSGNCIAIDSITVNTTDPLNFDLLSDTTVCGNKALMKANTTGISVQSIAWSFSNTFSPVIATLDTTTIVKSGGSTRVVYIRVIASNGCPVIDSAVITFNNQVTQIILVDDTITCNNQINLTAIVSPPSSVTWSDNLSFIPVLSSTTILSVTQIPKTVVYYIRAENGGCPVIDSVKVTVKDTFPQIQLADLLNICNDSVRLHPVLQNVTSIEWSLDRNFSNILSTQPGITIAQSQPTVTYYIRAFYNSCSVTDSIVVNFNNILPDITLSDSLAICDGIVDISAIVQNQDSIRWYGDAILTNVIASGPSLQTILTPGASKTYYIKAYYKGCSAIDSIYVQNNTLGYEHTNISVCKGSDVNIQLNVISQGNYSIDWKFNDSLFTTNTGNITLIQPISGTLVFTIANGRCRVKDSITVTVNDNPVVDALVDKDSIQEGEQVQLNTNPNTGLSFNWTPQNLVSNPTISNPTSYPEQTTIFIVQATDQNGCKAFDSVTVRVNNPGCSNDNVYIPNAFSPNGDGVNDIFRARVTGLRNIKLIIYNRLGEKVFETTDPSAGWDGNYKNTPAPSDSYGYYFSAECVQDEKIILKGNVTLLR